MFDLLRFLGTNKKKEDPKKVYVQKTVNNSVNLIMFEIDTCLRGGGCGTTKIPQIQIGKLNNSFPVDFAANLQDYTATISEKSFTFQDKLHQDEILSAFQWFYNNKEYFQMICNDDSINSKFYHLIEKCVETLLKSLIIYIKLSGFLFHQLLDICNDLFRVIFSYQLKNEERYMLENIKQNLLESITEIESQISIESMNIQKSGVEFEIQLIKTCLAHCRTDQEQEKEKELVISILCGAASSITELQPSSELIDSLIEAGKYLLLNFYDKQIQHPLQKYEIYYFFESLKWSVINQLKLGYSVQKTLNPLLEGYNQYIKSSQDWMIHSCWVKFISDLMSYRPIINKQELKQTVLIWNQLIITNQIVQLPYDKSSGKLQIFGKKSSLHLKQFKQLILFQEYLLDIQEKFELFPAYSKFEFNDKKKNQVDNDEFVIKLLISESALETISIISSFLKTSSEQLTNHFESINQQFCQTNKVIFSSKLNDKIFRDDISYLIKQIKIQAKSLLFSLYEMNILINQERESIAIIQNILQQNKQFFKENSLKSQSIILEKISQLEKQYLEVYQINVDKFPQFFIQLFHKLSVYKVEALNEDNNTETQKQNFKQTNFDQKQFNETILTLNKFLNKYISESKSIKKQFSKICISKDIKNFFNQKISLKGQSQIIINIYNLNMIQKIAGQFFEFYSQFMNQQKDAQVDLGLNLIWCNQIKIILKILQNFFELQQQKIVSLNQKQDVLTKDYGQCLNQTQNYSNFKLFLENLISEKKILLQNLLNNQKENRSQEMESMNLQEIILSINEGIDTIQQQNWPEDFKQIQIILFQEVINKLQILELKRNNQKQYIMEILQLFDRQVESLNQEQQLQQSQIQLMSKTNEMLQQDNKSIFDFISSQNLFHQEEQNLQIQELIQVVIKIERVIKQKKSNFQLTQVQYQKTISDIIGQTFNQNILEILSDMNIELIKCFNKICESKQVVFSDAFLGQLSEQPNLTSIHTLQVIQQNSQLFQQQNLVSNQEIITDKAYSFMLDELKKENEVGQGNELFDIFQDSSYKVREAVVFNLIKMQSIVQEFAIQDFCQNLLQQIWMIEKHASVRNILKNKELIEMQKQLFSKDLSNFSNKLKIDMQNKLKKLEQLETQVLIGDNKAVLKNQLQLAYEDFESYIDNITDMSQKMDISLIFLKEISKDLKSIKGSIDLVLQNMKGIEDDLRRLSGKSYTELLQIRKDKILKQKQEAELDQVHIQFITQEFDPLTGKRKENGFGNFKSHLITKQYNNYEGEVNEFLWSEGEKTKDVMLLKGKAGSGKSRASRNIEEFLWINELTPPQWIPIFVSLPSLKNPKHNLIEQALESQNYNFDKIQIREFKQAVTDGNLKIVFIFESYDEMKIEYIQSNLYQTNRFATDLNLQIPGQNVKFIITTREEILTSIGYQTWFYGKNLETFKEVELLPFNYEQSSEYIKQYCEVSIKRTVKKYYEFLKQLKCQNFSLNEFKLIWANLEDHINSIMNSKYDQDMLFQPSDVEKIISKLQTIEFFNYIRADQMIQLKKELLLLWSSQKFSSVINSVNINHLMSTPFMMEIIVYVLPKMSSTFSESNFLRDTLKQKYLQLKQEAHKQDLLIEQYQKQKKVIQVPDLQTDQAQLNQKSIETQNLLNQKLLENFLLLIEELEGQNFFESYSISHPIDFLDEKRIISRKVFTVTSDANFIVSAFKLNQFTAYDFYDTFSQFYHMQQLQKWKELGKTFNYETTLIDLHDFSLYLALDMTTYQLAQVDYKQKGRLQLEQALQEGKHQHFWEDQYFDENSTNSEYNGFLKKCILLRAKGSIYSFSHKSIQEFFVAKYILSLLKKVFQDNNFEFLTNSRFNQNQFNISLEHFQGAIELLKPKLKQILDVKQKLILIVQQSKKGNRNQQIISASNAIYLLCSLRENLFETDFSDIFLSDTKLNGLNFCKCNLNNSVFNNISIDSCNFNCAKIEYALWNDLICKEKPTLIGHKDTITSISFTKDGKNLISGSKDGTIKIWQVSGEDDPQNFSFSNNLKVISSSFSEETNLLACLTDQSIQILNCKDLILENYLPLINYDYKRVMLSSDGQYVAALTQSLKIYFWRIESLKNQSQTQRNILTLKFKIECTAISSSSKLLAIGGVDVILFSLNNFSDQRQIAVLSNCAQSLNFSSNEEILAVADKSKKINFWNIRNKDKIELIFSLQVPRNVKKLLYSADDKYLFSREEDTIILYDTSKIMSQQDIQSEVIFYKNISKKPQQNDFDLSKNSKFLAIATTSGIIIKNIELNQIIQTLEQENDYNSVQFVQDDELLIFSASWNRVIEIYDIKELNNMKKLQTISMPFKTLQVSYLYNSKQLLINNNQFLTLHNLGNQDNFKMLQISKSNNYNLIVINQYYFGICMDNQICFQLFSETVDVDFFLNYEKNEILYNNFSSDGKTFSVIFNRNCFNKYSIQTKQIIKQEKLQLNKIKSITLNKQETLAIILQNNDNEVKLLLYDIQSNKALQSFEDSRNNSHICTITSFSPDGGNFFTGYSNGTIKLWDTKTCKLLSMFQSNTPTITLISISNQGTLAQASQNEIKLWNITALQQQQFEMDGHSDSIQCFSKSPDGLQLVSSSNSEIIRWDLQEYKLIDVLLRESNLSAKIRFSSDSRYFATLDQDNQITVWKLNTKYMIERQFKLLFSPCINFNFSLQSNQIISEHISNVKLLWDLEKFSLISKNQYMLKNQQLETIIFSPDQTFYISKSPLSIVNIGQSKMQEKVENVKLSLQSKLGLIAISKDSTKIACEDIKFSIIIWCVKAKQQVTIFQDEQSYDFTILSMVFSGDSKLLLSVHADEFYRLWNLNEKEPLIEKALLMESLQCFSLSVIQVQTHKTDDFLIIWSQKQIQGSDEFEKLCFSFYKIKEPKPLQSYPLTESGSYSGYEERKNFIINFTIAYAENKKLLAVQWMSYLKIFDLASQEELIVLEGNSQNKSNISTILQFIMDEEILLGLGRDLFLRYWDLQGSIKINLKQKVSAKAFLYSKDFQVIRVLGQDNQLYDYQIENFTEICRYGNKKIESYETQANYELSDIFEYQIKNEGRQLEIIDKKTKNTMYILDQFSSEINCVTFSIDDKFCLLGMKDGSILIYDIDKITTVKYGKPICVKVFGKSPLLLAACCSIKESRFLTKEKENFQKLLCEKGAIS